MKKNNIVFTTQATSDIRTETMDDIEYLVAPVIAVVAGVLNGELLTADVIEESIKFWDDVPVPVNHPTINGAKISAKKISQIESVVIGRFYNAKFEDDSLKGEMWIDIAKTTKMGGDALDILERLQSGDVVEVSTAYHAKVTPVKGEFEGNKYNGIQSNIRPDHLALLSTKVGACSIADGCGANRTNEEDRLKGPYTDMKINLQEGESVSDRMGAVTLAVDPGWIVDLYEDAVVYELYVGDNYVYYKASYTIEDDTVVLGDAMPVTREVTYNEVARDKCGIIKRVANFAGKKIDQVKHLLEVAKMNDREKLIHTLNDRKVDIDETLFENVDDSILEWMVDNSKNVEGVDNGDAKVENKENEQVDEKTAKFNEFLEDKGIDVEDVLESLKTQEEAKASEKQGLVDGLKANEDCTISEESLEALDVSALNELTAAYKPGTYLGTLVPNSKETVPVAPSIVMNETKDGE